MQFKVLFMESKNFHDDLSHIRTMMERSSRFISLSGLSGVFAGMAALIGVTYVYFLFQRNGIDYFAGRKNIFQPELIWHLIAVGIAVLVIAVLSGYFFTARKSKEKNIKIWDKTTQRLLANFALPLFVGAIFCVALLYHQLYVLIAPATLIFYGLALVSAERYTLTDVKYLGFLEIFLGLISLFFLGWGLVFWAVGFGILHIIYGIVMYKKYK
ncbi:hypothetical protein SAMN05421876_102382 [Kaistella jeonii]|nr:hypothetical protein SAMN05421876_102382 [Kaistella jeonii]VEI96136.1 Uncharacterised protein [Kaistella jeonii]